jgi:hypothetical protein
MSFTHRFVNSRRLYDAYANGQGTDIRIDILDVTSSDPRLSTAMLADDCAQHTSSLHLMEVSPISSDHGCQGPQGPH